MAKKEIYSGPERREYCAQHCVVSEQSSKSVPRWVFIGSLSTMVAIAMAFAGWHVASLDEFKIDINSRLSEMEVHLESRISDMQASYNRDVMRFYRAAEVNQTLLHELSQKIGVLSNQMTEFKTKQDLVVRTIGLGERPATDKK